MKTSHTYTDRTFRLTLVLLCAVSLLDVTALLAERRSSAPVSKMQPDAKPLESSTSRLAIAQAREAYGQIEMSFEASTEQSESGVNFLARGAGYTLFLKPTEAVFALRNSDCELRNEDRAGRSLETDARHSKANPQSAICDPQSKVLRLKLAGANETAAVAGADELPGKVNYFIGDDPAKWRANIPTFGRVRYAQVYPGVDLVYYGNQRQLEYDFVVAPGRDARAVKLQFDGADKVEVDAAGDLLLTLGETVIRQPKPVVYQEVGGSRRTVEGGYAVGADGQVGFTVGEYDASLPLVIDPVLVYSTYLGGSGTDSGNDIAVDSSGNAYICGDTTSTNFPTANAIDGTFGAGTFMGARDAFVTKLNATGTALVYSTYLGGSGNPLDGSQNGDDRCFGVRVDGGGNAYVAGETHSDDFPTANAFQGTRGGGFSDAFVAKLNPAGSALVYSTFIGGSVFDAAAGIELDSSQNVYITGRTTSPNFPTVNPIQSTFAGGSSDAFVTKLNAAGTALVYSTYLGGTDFENGSGIAVDSAGNAYLAGQTRSTNFPTANAIQGTFGGGTPDGDAFVTKINAAGSALVYSTYIGGSDNDPGFDIAVDSSGSAHVTGSTSSTNFPVANAIQGTLNGTSDAFVTKLNAAGSAFVYSTYLGGSDADSGNDIALDSSGNAYVAGGTISTNFPTANPIQSTYGGGAVDAFVTKLNAAGSALVYSTYLGGGSLDRANAIAVDSCGSAYVSGITGSTNFTTLNPVQGTNGGGDDAFVTKISDGTTTLQFSQATYNVNEDVTFVNVTVQRTGDISTAVTVDYATADGTASERSDYTTALGTLRFAASETSKTVAVLVNEDSRVEGAEAFTITLSNPTGGASLACTSATATIQIADDASEPSTNAIDDSTIFVGQHYHDFLNRQSDPAGLAFWVNEIESCGADAQCRAVKRINVSAAFFLSIEFQQTGYFVIRTYKSAFGSTSGNPAYRPFLRDTQEVGRGVIVGTPGADALLEANKQAFAMAFVQRADFQAAHGSQNADQYVDSLFANAGATPTTSERAAAITAFASGDTAGRAAALRSVIESGSVINKLYNPAFVLMQYFGYLRRNPNDAPDGNFSGYDFWLTKMNQFSLPGEDVRNEQVALSRVQRAEMVKAFIISGEYRGRFGP